MVDRYAWKRFGYPLDSLERSLKGLEYRGTFEPPEWPKGLDSIQFSYLPPGALALAEVDWVLSVEALAPPHGLYLLTPPPPSMPALPTMSDEASMEPRDK